MKQLINKIYSKEYDLANEILAESFVSIVEKKFLEKKKAVAAKMCEQMMTRAKKLRSDVLENIDPDEARGGPKSTEQIINRAEKTDKEEPNTTVVPKNNLKEDDMNLFDDDDDKKQKPRKAKLYRHKTSGKEIMHVGQPRDKDFKLVKEDSRPTYRAGYKYDPVKKTTNAAGDTRWSQTATKGFDDKPDYAGKTKEVRHLDNTLSAGGKESSSYHNTIKDVTVRPDKNDGKGGDYDVSTSTKYTNTKLKEEDEQLDEARIGIIKARVRGGKVQRRKKVSNVPGFRLQGGQLKRMSAAERRRRKLGAKRGKIKRKVKMSRILQKRQRSLRRRASLGV